MKNIFLISLFFLAVITSGCGGNFPQYSGEFELLGEPEYSDPSFQGELQIPHKLVVLNRADFASGYFRHYIETSFQKSEEDIAEEKKQGKTLFPEAKFYFNMDDLMIRPGQTGFGAIVHKEEKQTNGAFIDCWAQVEYSLRVRATPMPSMLRDIYPTHGKVIKKATSSQSEQVETLTDENLIEKTELNETAVNNWDDTIDSVNGIVLQFEFTRKMASHLTQLHGEQCILIPDPLGRKDASVKFTYISTKENDSFDLRLQGFEEIIGQDVRKEAADKHKANPNFFDMDSEFFHKVVSQMALTPGELIDLKKEQVEQQQEEDGEPQPEPENNTEPPPIDSSHDA